MLVLLKLPAFCIYWWHSLRSNPPLRHLPSGAGDDAFADVDFDVEEGDGGGPQLSARGTGSARVHPSEASQRYRV